MFLENFKKVSKLEVFQLASNFNKHALTPFKVKKIFYLEPTT